MNKYLNVLEYIKSITSELHCSIAIKDFIGFIAKDPDVADILNPYFIHKSSFCMYMKSQRDMWTRCQNTSKLLFQKCNTVDRYFTGTCYCGCSEVVIPVKYDENVIAAICIYGFEINAKRAACRIQKAVKKYKINKAKAVQLYNESVREGSLDIKLVLIRCGILVDFLLMYYKALINCGAINDHEVYNADTSRIYILSNSLEFIRLNYANDIHVTDIASFCRCSESYISHIFKKSMNQSVSQYLNKIRIEKAKELISGTSGSFYEISGKCGFSDPNYFSTVFKRITGSTPKSYRFNAKGEMIRD